MTLRAVRTKGDKTAEPANQITPWPERIEAGGQRCYGARAVRSLALSLLVLAVALGQGACLVVRPHQRENLARRSMTVDRDRGEARFGQHQTGSREGADGGTGQPGGGCGCN